jgi:hypothetical protein
MQDTPAIKQRYTANVTAPVDFNVLMSATKIEYPKPVPDPDSL